MEELSKASSREKVGLSVGCLEDFLPISISMSSKLFPDFEPSDSRLLPDLDFILISLGFGNGKLNPSEVTPLDENIRMGDFTEECGRLDKFKEDGGRALSDLKVENVDCVSAKC